MLSWKQFEWMDFSHLTRRIPKQDVMHPARISTKSGWKRHHSRESKQLNDIAFLQSPELGSLAFERRRKKLTVPALRRFSLLAEDQTPCVQTIPSEHDTL
ncbi:MAG: hypothetical protein M9908_14225 [Phyllobacteriaceae bacterium]|nr:hypothetical protein [Phyllobacteriaceae bacterium]